MRHENFDHKPSGSHLTERAAATGPRNGSEAKFEAPKLHTPKHNETSFNKSLISSALDLEIAVTIFPDVYAASAEQRLLSMRQLASTITHTKGVRKDKLPLLKLARFGEKRRPQKNGHKGKCLRWDENMLGVTGIEGDYDAGRVSMEDAAQRLKRAGIAALLYTSTHHRPDEPRWRVLCPLMEEIPHDQRDSLCAKLNGALEGILADESFTASQAYYFGAAELRDAKHGGDPAHPLELILLEGKALDAAPECNLHFSTSAPKEEKNTQRRLKEQAKTGRALSVIKSALQFIPNGSTVPSDWLHFNRVGMALHEETDGSSEGLLIFDAWSRQHPTYNQAECLSRWESYRAGNSGNIGGRTIFALAKKNGWSESACMALQNIGEIEERVTEKTPRRLRVQTIDDYATAPLRKYIIKGMLSEGDIACFFGPPGSGKSLLLPFISHIFCQGGDVFGMRSKPGSVLYVAAEDENGMRGRLTALDRAYGRAPELYLVSGVSSLLDPQCQDLRELVKTSKEKHARLIIIDTLAMAFPSLEENTAEGMGRVVGAARALASDGAAVILIHHDTKAEGSTPRGHSLLNGALDLAVHVKREAGGRFRGVFTKNRNGTCDHDLTFQIILENAGWDEEGDPIILPRCEPIAASKSSYRLSTPEQAVLAVLKQAGGLLAEAEVRKRCLDNPGVSGSNSVDSRKKATARALKSLLEKGVIHLGERGYSIS